MLESPSSLREYCLEILRESITDSVLEPVPEGDGQMSSFHLLKRGDYILTQHLSEELLSSLSNNEQLNDEVMVLFDTKVTQLKRVVIPDASQLTTKGLRVLRGHRITDLEVIGLSKMTINELIGCLGEWTLSHLKNLNVAHSSLASSNKFCVVVGLAKLQNLQILDVSHTEFNHHVLEMVVQDLPLLNSLNISATRVTDISPLKKCRERLRYLSMYNLRSSSGGCEGFVPILCELNNLRHLDISDDRDNPLDVLTPLRDCTNDILKRPECFTHLKSLDLSGKEAIDSEELTRFLAYKRALGKQHCLTFLGLMQTTLCSEDIFINPTHPHFDVDLITTGNANEKQILESLLRYHDRSAFVQKSLYHLYNHTLTFTEPRTDVIDAIITPMRKHSKVLAIQMASTACLYNLTKGKIGDKLHPKWLKQVAESTLNSMENHPHHLQLQKNTLLTLCSDRILQDVTFNRFKCTKLVMDTLVSFHDVTMNRMAVAICSILAAKISTLETSMLGAHPTYMGALCELVHNRLSHSNSQNEPDIMLKYTLSALWNLTDESPCTCKMFLEKGGLKMYLEVLNKFTGHSSVETKVLGLLNNIAEVDSLRHYLMDNLFLTSLWNLLHSSYIDVSYFAAGIFAHLSCNQLDDWSQVSYQKSIVLQELKEVILAWKQPEIEMVAYRSFSPFLPLLTCKQFPEVQLWSLWAIHHVCSKNPKRYCSMLIEEQALTHIYSIYEYMNQIGKQEDSLAQLCKLTIQVVYEEIPGIQREIEKKNMIFPIQNSMEVQNRES